MLVRVRLGTVLIAFYCDKMLSRSTGHSEETRPRPMAWPSDLWHGPPGVEWGQLLTQKMLLSFRNQQLLVPETLQ